MRRNLNSSAGNYLPLADAANPFGCALLDFLSKGSAILTELSRLAERIPITNTSSQFLFTFEEYFQNPEVQDMRVSLTPKLAAMDLAFAQQNSEYLSRFYLCCVGISKLGAGFNSLMRDLQRGFYVSHTLEQVLLDVDGKQWLPECLHILGTTLLLLDARFPSTVRQQLIVAYYRANRALIGQEFDLVMNLIQPPPTIMGSTNNPKEALLAKFQVNPTVAAKIFMRVQSDDLYNHTRAWPSSEHRSTALSKQSAMLFTSLLFCEKDTQVMSTRAAEMREIVDRFFPDCWVVALCNTLLVDVSTEWSAYYPAAKQAVERTMSKQSTFANANDAQILACQNSIDELLIRGGLLTEKYVLENWEFLLGVIRQSNVSLRWRLLHRSKHEVPRSIRLLLSISRLEEIVKEAVGRILQTKRETFELHQQQVGNRMLELAEYFAKSNLEISQWFTAMRRHVNALEYTKVLLDGRRILQLVRSIEEVERIDIIEDSSLQVKEFLLESKLLLEKLVRVLNVKEEILVQIEVVSDFSLDYCLDLDSASWELQFQNDPHSVSLLSSLFAKLNTCLEQTLCRIAQNPSSLDCPSVAEYWGKKLCLFLQTNVLSAIPRMVFHELDHLPAVGMLDSSEARYDLSLTLFKIALWAGNLPPKQGVGSLEFDPKHEFLVGLRSETLQRMIGVISTSSSKTGGGDDWRRALEQKAGRFTVLQTNLETLQDYFKHASLRNMFIDAQQSLLIANNPQCVAYATHLVKECLIKRVDWSNERDFFPLARQLEQVFGKQGLCRICTMLCREAELQFTSEFKIPQQLALAQLDMNAVEWGSEEWVDCVREARRKYVGTEVDLRSLKRAGMAFIASERLRFAAKLDEYAADGPIQTPVCAKRAFVLVNELAKRMCQYQLDSVFANYDFYYAICGIALLSMRNPQFAKDLNEMAQFSCKALLQRSYSERKGAEASLVFKYGKQKVAKVALERLAAEQSAHRAIAFVSKRLDRTTAASCMFAEIVAKAWKE